MNMKRKQHILPASYLMQWVDPATTIPGKTPMVWTISKDMKSRHARPPAAGHFWRDYFYDLISQSGKRRQNLEDLLGKIEGAFANIIQRRIPLKEPLAQVEAENLDLFVACMFMRTQHMRQSVVSAVSAMARIEREHAASHGYPIPDTSVYEHNAHAHAIYDGILFISDHLSTMAHNIFIAPVGKSYVTSDTPCVWQAPLGPLGLANPHLEIYLPLSPKHMLLISKSIPTSGYIEAKEFWVDQANWDTIRHCREYFIANSQVVETCWQEGEADRLQALLEGALAMG
jgi:hypothetical protein